MSVRSHRAVRLGVSAALMTSFSANAHVRTAGPAKPTLRLSGKYWPAIFSLDPYLSLIWPAKMGRRVPLRKYQKYQILILSLGDPVGSAPGTHGQYFSPAISACRPKLTAGDERVS